MSSTDTEFLTWLKDRLIHVYGVNPNVDYVLRLEQITHNIGVQKLKQNLLVNVLNTLEGVIKDMQSHLTYLEKRE